MKRKFGTPFWALPALVAMGVIAAVVVVMGLGHSTSDPVSAAHGGSSTATNNPTTAGQVIELVFQFDVDTNIPSQQGEFVVTFDKDTVVPSSLSRSAVLMSASIVTNCTGGAPCSGSTPSTGAGGQAVPLEFDPTFDVDEDDARKVKITMKVPDMDPSTSDPGVGTQGIGAGSTVTVTITTSAGFRNAEEADSQSMTIAMSDSAGGTNRISSGTSVKAPTVIKIFTSAPSRRRGQSLTVIGRGYKGDLTATVWLDNGVDLDGDGKINQKSFVGDVNLDERVSGIDLNGDGDATDTEVDGPWSEVALGMDLNFDGDADDTAVTTLREFNFRNNAKRDAGERDLGGAIVGGDGTFTAAFTVANPPFLGGVISEVQDLNADGDTADTDEVLDLNFDGDTDDSFDRNVINAIDGEASVASITNSRSVKLNPKLSLEPPEAAIGDTLTLTLKDFTPDGVVISVTLAGSAVDISGLSTAQKTIDPNGELTLAVKIPGQGIPIGVQVVLVDVDIDADGKSDEDHDTEVNVLGATLSTSHTDLIANQDLTISGSGFSEGSGVCIDAGKITVSNVPLLIDNDSTDSACTNGTGVKVTSGGTFVATVIVRSTDTTTPFPSSLLTSGSHELKVIDNKGTEGKLDLVIKKREFSLDPPAAGPRETLTIIGSGYPADNADTDSPSVTLKYDCGSQCSRSVTADPDFSGNFREPLRVPSNAPIPSTNTVTSTISGTTTVDTITHDVPKANVSVSPGRGASGNPVTISGNGFRDFDTVQEIKIGGLGALGGRTINTDTNGAFEADDIIVPGLDPGIHSLEVTVGTGSLETTANTSFEVLAEAVSGVTTAVAAGVAPLGEALVRAFNFNNATKAWIFYDPRPEFAAANTLLEFIDGAIYWFRVTTDQLGVVLNGRTRNFTCLNPGTPQEDCWNQDTW
ncbi:MAG: IPT/TIG domain-containing protein [Dehalococcoidia bacterium]